jgi:hypothetical protein
MADVKMLEAKNMKLISQDNCLGYGGIGEGIALQKTKDGRRVLWLAHESAPKNFTGIDVTDPKKPKVIIQTDLPHNKVRSNSLETTGDLMCVAYQTATVGLKPAGFDMFDISVPEKPKLISHYDCSGPHSRGIHQVWFVDGEYVHCAAGGPDFIPTHPLDDQPYRIIDVRDPSKPKDVGLWWQPGTRKGDSHPPMTRLPRDSGWRAHNTNVYPARPDRAYIGNIDGGAWILDISDKSNPKPISNWNPHPPYPGMTHTVMPLFSRDLLIVTEEATDEKVADWPKLTWIVDARNEKNIFPISTLPLPPMEEFQPRGGRYGSHNLWENKPDDVSFQSDTIIFGTFFSGGLRVFDTTNPLQPKEIGAFVPEAPKGGRATSIQFNDVHVDENGLVYTVDRHSGGLYIVECDF